MRRRRRRRHRTTLLFQIFELAAALSLELKQATQVLVLLLDGRRGRRFNEIRKGFLPPSSTQRLEEADHGCLPVPYAVTLVHRATASATIVAPSGPGEQAPRTAVLCELTLVEH